MIHHVVYLTCERRCVTFFPLFQFYTNKKTRLNLKRVLIRYIISNSTRLRQDK